MEGQRVKKTKGGRRKSPIIAAAVVAALLIAYLGLCAWVGSNRKILPNVSVAGVDVSGMTTEQAKETLEQAVADHGDEIAVNLHYKDWTGTLTGADLQVDWDFQVLVAQTEGRGGFLTQGAHYLINLVNSRSQLGLARSAQDSQPALDALLDRADEEIGGNVNEATYRISGDKLEMTKGVTGVAMDREQTWPDVMDAFDQAFDRKFAQGEEGLVSVDVDLAATENPPREPDFNAIHQELYTEAKSAEMAPETHQILDHVVGVDFDPQVLRSAYGQAAEGETFSIPLTLTQPEETKTSLESKLFRDLLGQGTSNVGGSANRKHNVKLSAAACNGVILLPGEVFSYNNTTGSRSASKGYLAAPVYSGGASVDEVGGGICQTSSTIYYAVLHTTLEVVERRNHMYAVGYVPDGMDATVYYGSTDFRFKNNTDYPVKIVTESYDKGGQRKLTVKIYGTNVDGRYAVPKETVFDEITPTKKYVADNTVPQGTLVLDKKQNAYRGRSAQTYRYIYEKNGSLVEKQNMGVSKYKMRPSLYYYNPLDGDPASWPNGLPPKPAQPEKPVDPVTPTEPPVVPVDPVQPEVPAAPDGGQGAA